MRFGDSGEKLLSVVCRQCFLHGAVQTATLPPPAVEDTFHGCPYGGPSFGAVHAPSQKLIVVCVLVPYVRPNSQFNR